MNWRLVSTFQPNFLVFFFLFEEEEEEEEEVEHLFPSFQDEEESHTHTHFPCFVQIC
jgi:hypothetical protein